MGSSFGDRLKQERLSRQLTQGELGGDLYSASYISLLENAHREPTTDIIKQLARQLQMAPSTIAEWAQPASPAESEYLRLSLCARQCWDTRDYLGAATNAKAAARSGPHQPEPRDLVEHDVPERQLPAAQRRPCRGH